MSNDFQYSELISPWSIRVIEVLPASSLEAPLQCRLIHTVLDPGNPGRRQYEALSYVWGERTGTRPIQCSNGSSSFKLLLVTPNCEAAIRYLRNKVTSRILWIDAISINQQDNCEKSIQLKMMGEIYKGASRALVWLGEDSSFSRSGSYLDILTNLMQQTPVFASFIAGNLKDSEATAIERKAESLIHLGGSFISDVGCRIGGANAASQGIIPFFQSKDWFWRIWTIQELALAEEVSVIIGEKTLPWKLIEAILDRYTSSLSSETDLDDKSLEWIRVSRVRSSIRHELGAGGGLKTNYQILNRLSDNRATDPKDMIFGVQQLIKNCPSLPDPNYEKSVGQVYEETVVAAIRDTQSLAIFIHSRIPSNSSLTLPSWVPDWSCRLGLDLSDTTDNNSRNHSILRIHYMLDLNPIHEDAPFTAFNVFLGPFATRNSKYSLPSKCVKGQLPVSLLPLGTLRHLAPAPFTSEGTFKYEELLGHWLQFMPEELIQSTEKDDLWVEKIMSHFKTFSTNSPGRKTKKSEREFLDWMKLMVVRDPRMPSSYYIPDDSRTSKLSSLAAYSTYDVILRLRDQHPFITSDGHVGIAESRVQEGDLIALVRGADFPFVLRRNGEEHFSFIGCAYVWGAIRGELWHFGSSSNIKERFESVAGTLMRRMVVVGQDGVSPGSSLNTLKSLFTPGEAKRGIDWDRAFGHLGRMKRALLDEPDDSELQKVILV